MWRTGCIIIERIDILPGQKAGDSYCDSGASAVTELPRVPVVEKRWRLVECDGGNEGREKASDVLDSASTSPLPRSHLRTIDSSATPKVNFDFSQIALCPYGHTRANPNKVPERRLAFEASPRFLPAQRLTLG